MNNPHSFTNSSLFIKRFNPPKYTQPHPKLAPKILYNQWLKLLRSTAYLHEYRVHARPDCNF